MFMESSMQSVIMKSIMKTIYMEVNTYLGGSLSFFLQEATEISIKNLNKRIDSRKVLYQRL